MDPPTPHMHIRTCLRCAAVHMRWIHVLIASSTAFKLEYCAAFQGLPAHASMCAVSTTETSARKDQRSPRVQDESMVDDIVRGLTAVFGIRAGIRSRAVPSLRRMHCQWSCLSQMAITLSRVLQIQFFFIPRAPLTPQFVWHEVRAA